MHAHQQRVYPFAALICDSYYFCLVLILVVSNGPSVLLYMLFIFEQSVSDGLPNCAWAVTLASYAAVTLPAACNAVLCVCYTVVTTAQMLVILSWTQNLTCLATDSLCNPSHV